MARALPSVATGRRPKEETMAAIDVRKEQPKEMKTQTEPTGAWDPARVMRQFFGWDPFRGLDPFREMTPMLRPEGGFAAAFEVKESKDGYTFRADVPGVKEGDIEITVTGNRLNISGKRDAEKQERTDTYYAYERSYGSFARSFTLPESADMQSVHAELRDGVLTVSVGRKPALQPQKIPLKIPAAKS
jgi:HSP20 family protein